LGLVRLSHTTRCPARDDFAVAQKRFGEMDGRAIEVANRSGRVLRQINTARG